MKRRAIPVALALGLSVIAFGGPPAFAAAGGTPAINCIIGNPAQAARVLGAVGPRPTQTPVDLAQQLGFSSPGAALNAVCTTPADQHL